jgi:hypothetical protein
VKNLPVYTVLALVFAVACILAGQFPIPWPYVFGAGLVVGAMVGINRHQSESWRIPVVLCLAAGTITAPTLFQYPVTEILGLYLAVAALIAASGWWWQSPPFSPRKHPNS